MAVSSRYIWLILSKLLQLFDQKMASVEMQ